MYYDSKTLMVRAEYIEVENNVRLHITDAGKGRPIVLVHGWPLSDEMFEYQYQDLINNNFRVIGITLRGFGKSDKPWGEYSYDIHVLDIKKVLCELDIDDAILVGFSMGAAIAIRYMSVYKSAHISKLALCGAAAPIWTQRNDFPYNLPIGAVDELIKLNQEDRPKLLTNFSEIFSATPNSLSNGMAKWINNMGLMASSYAMSECLVALRDTDLRGDLDKITVPTIIMHGKKDKVCSFDLAEQLHAGIKNSQLVAFQNSGHSMFLEEKQKFNNLLVKFSISDLAIS